MSDTKILPKEAIVLPDPPNPCGNYSAVVQHDSLLFVSGQLPLRDGELQYRGRLGAEVDVATGYQAARLCALNALAHIQRAVTSFDTIVGLARVEGYLQSVPSFQDHARVLDGASDLFYEVLGKDGSHARAVFGVNSLPLNSPVELVLTARISWRRGRFWHRLLVAHGPGPLECDTDQGV
jgi:enamine deaminase RidA (YjgF/YER057c/UK114 family)